MPFCARSLDDLLHALPDLLGFAPHDSLVVVLLGPAGDSRSHPVVLTVRVDLPRADRPPGDPGPRAFADLDVPAVLAGVASSRAVSAVVLAFVPSGCEVDSAVLGAVTDALSDAGVDLFDVAITSGGRCRSLMCPGDGCCPPEGLPYREAAMADPTRRDVVDRLAPDPVRRARVARLMARDTDSAADADAAEDTRAGAVVEVLALARCATGSDRALARCLQLLRDVQVRDAVLAAALRDDHGCEADVLRFMVRLTRAAPEGAVPAPASIAAVLHWVRGDGASTNAALDRALADDPDYSLARLVEATVRAAVPPQEVRALLANAA